MTGINDPDFHLTIDITSGTPTLFIPKYAEDHALWCGEPITIDQAKQEFGINQVKYETDLSLSKEKVYVIDETNHPTIDKNNVDRVWLAKSITECRLIKSDYEIELMRKAAKISCEAHKSLMKSASTANNERELHSLFAYTPIVGYAKNASVLHYIKNSDNLDRDSSYLILVDAGCEFNNYASDITRTFPLNGKFEGDHRIVYEIVLECQLAVLEALKPGVEWEDMHRLANRVICVGLKAAGIIIGDVDELISNTLPALFFPHGLGHLIGIDVHDVGGYPEGVERIQEPGIKYLRMRRALRPGFVVTVEPGVYFVDAILDPAIKDPIVSKYLNLDVLERFRSVGGVRIEDDVLITENGIEILTQDAPKTIKEIESIMKKDK